MAEVDDDDVWQEEPKSTRQIGGNIVDKEREELDEENLYRSCVNAVNATWPVTKRMNGKDGEVEKREEERRRRKIEEDDEDGRIERERERERERDAGGEERVTFDWGSNRWGETKC